MKVEIKYTKQEVLDMIKIEIAKMYPNKKIEGDFDYSDNAIIEVSENQPEETVKECE